MTNSYHTKKIMGRPLITIDEDEFQLYYQKWMCHSKSNPFNLDTFAKKLGISKSTLMRRLKMYKNSLKKT
jgi:hypothetical protein